MPGGKGFQTRPEVHSFARILSAEDESQIRQKQKQKEEESALEKEEKLLKKEVQPKNKEEQKDEQKTKEVLDKQASIIEKELQEAKIQETSLRTPVSSAAAHIKVFELENQLRTTLAQKQQLERQLFALSRKFETQQEAVFAPTQTGSTANVKTETPNVIQIPKGMGAKFGLPIAPDVPNLITGIIKDSRGNILSNILVEIKDKDGNPVRAFKTNNLGQFASATPLLNGVYTLIFEDPEEKHNFDRVEITVSGEIVLPIEIISTDAREELRKELFGT